MIVSNKLHSDSTFSAPAAKPAPSPIVLFALKSIAFVAACFLVITAVLHIYLVVVVTGLIAVTALALRHCMIQEASAARQKNANNYAKDDANRSEHDSPEPSPKSRRMTKLESTHPTHPAQKSKALTQDELDALENTPEKIRERVNKLPRYMDNSYLDIPKEAYKDHNHPYWDKYDITKPTWKLRPNGPPFRTVT